LGHAGERRARLEAFRGEPAELISSAYLAEAAAQCDVSVCGCISEMLTNLALGIQEETDRESACSSSYMQ